MVNPVTNLLILSVYRCKECLSTKSGRLKQSNVLLHPNVTLHPSVNWKSPTQRKFQLSVIKSDEWKSQNFNIVYIELYWKNHHLPAQFISYIRNILYWSDSASAYSFFHAVDLLHHQPIIFWGAFVFSQVVRDLHMEIILLIIVDKISVVIFFSYYYY